MARGDQRRGDVARLHCRRFPRSRHGSRHERELSFPRLVSCLVDGCGGRISMGDADARRLVFHGAAVLLVGLLAGIPYSTAITGGWGPEAVRAWQKAHLGIVAGGMMLVAVAGAA